MDRSVEVSDQQQAGSRLRLVLAVLCAADFLVVLDGLVVAVALPAMQQALAISVGSLQWVITTYALCFGGLLLLSGRLGDLYGRRRVLVVGLLLFAAGSLLAGLAWMPLALFGGRALQGIGAAAMTPTALSLLTVAFSDPAARARAYGVWSAVSSAGIPAGALLGGVLTATAGWRWVLLVNVPAALVAAAVTRAVVDESAPAERPPGLDWAGAVLVTAGLAAVIAGITQAEHAHTAGALLGRVLTPVVLGLMLLSAFVVVERRTSAPLVPLDQLRAPGLLSVNLVGLVLPVGLGTGLFLGTLYLQLVVGLNPLYTGLAYLALALPCIIASPLASRLTLRLGRRATATAGLLLQAAGLLLLARVTATTGNLANVLPGFVLIGLGAPTAFVPTTATAMDSPNGDTGLASGLFNTSQQLGNALALAAIATLAATWTPHPASASASHPAAGYAAGFLLAAGITLAALIPAVRLSMATAAREPSTA
jgi:EmrB/QacA subfamily drug resistance transporter